MIKNERVVRFKTGCFERKFHWDCVSLGNISNGLILQHIEKSSRFVNFNLSSAEDISYNNSYFEYWKVENSVVMPDSNPTNSTDYDDMWSIMPKNWNERLIDCAKKYKSSADIVMSGKVYTVDINDQCYTQLTNCLRPGYIKSAGNLPSLSKNAYLVMVSKRWLPSPSQLIAPPINS